MKAIFFQTNKAKQGGFTLIEIMISLALGLVLMGGVISVFISTKQAYVTKENSARMQENVTFASDLLRRMISNASGITAGNSNSFTITNSSNCTGSNSASSNSFSVSNKKELRCTDGTNDQPLIDNVQSISITYGQDTTPTPKDGQVDSYANVPTADTISVRITMTMILDPIKNVTQNVTITAAIRSRILSKIKLSS